jgi:hypothetical protein
MRQFALARITLAVLLFVTAGDQSMAATANLFVTNGSGSSVGEYTTTGQTVNASLVPTGSGLFTPEGIAIDGADFLVAEFFAGRIASFNSTGTPVSIGDGFDGTMFNPEGITAYNGDLFVANYANGYTDWGTIGEFTLGGDVVNTALITGLTSPVDVAAAGGFLYVASFGSGNIREYTTAGVLVNASFISGMSSPHYIAISGSDMFITDFGTHSVAEYTTAGTLINASLISGFDDPAGIVAFGGNLFVADSSKNTIGEYTTTGAVVNASLISGLHSPIGLAVMVPGDTNGDAIVNGQDLALVSSDWLAKGRNAVGDVNSDGIVNGQDLALISSNWLAGSAPASAASAVPEPSSVIFAALGGLALLAMRQLSRTSD